MLRQLAGATLLLLAAGCGTDQPTGPEPGRPNLTISDSAHAGNDHFFLLPPLVKQPAFTGTFDPTLDAIVTVCEWNGSACVGNPLATFSRVTGTGSELLRVEPGEEQYIVNFHTDRFELDPTKIYRIGVAVGSYQLGYADVDPVNTRRELKNVNTGEYIPLVNGSTLPIKVRIEEGAVPADGVPLSAGGNHSCFLTTTGEAYCMGWNYYGQLGTGGAGALGGPNTANTPVAVTGGHRFVEIAAGDVHTCGRKVDGSVWCWGYNSIGTLGRGTFTYVEPLPAPVVAGVQFASLAAGTFHNCGLDAGGTAYCWGYNGQGQLGNGSTSHSPSPVAVPGHAFTEIAAGVYHTCAVGTTGSAYCWGYGAQGQRGDGTFMTIVPSPTSVGFGGTLSNIAAGLYHSCALDGSGNALCWGANFDGQLGLGAPSGDHASPQAVAAGALAFRSLDVGYVFTCGVAQAGAGYCWGNNFYGQLGIGSVGGYRATPTAISGGRSWSLLSAGGVHTCGVTTTGEGFCWGNGGLGQLGSGSFANSFVPVPIVGSYTLPAP